MDISITFRHMDSSDAIKAYTGEKLTKLQKFLRRPMTAKVTLWVDRLKHVAEARISSGGEHLDARQETDDMYASIDAVMGKLERQIRATKGAARARRHDGSSIRTAPVASGAASAREAASDTPKRKAKTKVKTKTSASSGRPKKSR
jgi:putative sigma-54 modulation protein